MPYEKPLALIDNVKEDFDVRSDNRAKSQVPHESSFTVCVTKVSRHRSREDYSSKRRNHASSIQNVQARNRIHVTIRPTGDILSTDPRSTHYQNKKHSQEKHQPNASSTNKRVEKQIHPKPVNVETAHYTVPIKEHHRRKSKNKTPRRLPICCCHCSCLHVILTLFGVLLLGIAIAAALVGSLIKNKTIITSTDSINTAVTTNLGTIEMITSEVVTSNLITTGITSLTATNVTVYGIWNTTSGGDSTPSTVGSGVGNYFTGEIPSNVFDNDTNTKYTNYGVCTAGSVGSLACGVGTGLYLTFQGGPSLLLYVQFCTANSLPVRDPLTITIEGSNQSPSLLTLGSSWILIYNGSTGLELITNRYTCGASQSIPNHSIWYSSYRILVTSKRGSHEATQYSEVKLMGY